MEGKLLWLSKEPFYHDDARAAPVCTKVRRHGITQKGNRHYRA